MGEECNKCAGIGCQTCSGSGESQETQRLWPEAIGVLAGLGVLAASGAVLFGLGAGFWQVVSWIAELADVG